MANEEEKVEKAGNKTPVTKGGAVKRTDEKPNSIKRTAKWFREMKNELKKVIWPTPELLVKNSLVALSVIVVAAIVLWGFDTLADNGVKAFITLVG